MLENYEKELSTKRRERRIFWLVVWVFSTFLYLFFQGYYPYIRLDIAGYLNPIKKTSETDAPQIVRAFGIINIRTIPAADSITVNGTNFINGDKVIYDYGEYKVEIQKNGFIGLKTKAILDKKNPFLIEALELLKKPVATKYAFEMQSISPLSGTKLIAEVIATGSTSHTLYRTFKVFDPDAPETARTFTSSLSPIGRGYFASETGAIFSFDDTTYKLSALKNKSGTGFLACTGATLVGEELYCPKTQLFLTGDSDFTSKIISIKDSIISTPEGIFNNRMEKLRKTSEENSGALAKIDDIVQIAGREYYLYSGKLSEDLPDTVQIPGVPPREFDTKPMKSVGKALRFGGDIMLLGYMEDGKSGIVLVDERGNTYPVSLGEEQVSNLKIQSVGTGYLIYSKTKAYYYQRGAENPELLAEWDILFANAERIFFKKDGITNEMLLVAGKQ